MNIYIIKNAFRSIGRSKGRNFLIGIIVFVIAISTCLGLSIRQAAVNAKESALEGINISATISYEYAGQMEKMYCIIGKSGAGKTTLLSLLSGLTNPNQGEIFYKDKSIASIDKYFYRSKYIGVVFQSYNLKTKYTALENIVLSMYIAEYKTERKNPALQSYFIY